MQRIARFIEQNAKHFEISQGEKRKSLLARFCLALRLGTPPRLPRRNGVRLRRGLSCSVKPLRFLLSAPLRMTQGASANSPTNLNLLHSAHACFVTPWPLFSLLVRGTKRKASKREMPCIGLCPKPRSLLKKRDQNLTKRACANTPLNPNLLYPVRAKPFLRESNVFAQRA